MPKSLDLTGKVFDQLTVIEPCGRLRGGILWRCKCACGNFREVISANLVRGVTKSCGCRRLEYYQKKNRKHGHAAQGANSRTYRSWVEAKDRCFNKNSTGYPMYGGRGITMSPKWTDDYPAFLADMGDRPAGRTLDRYPNRNGHYEPGNCRWATPREQSRNTSTNVLLKVGDDVLTIAEWAERVGVMPELISHRLKKGWSVEEAIFKPVNHSPQFLAKKKAKP